MAHLKFDLKNVLIFVKSYTFVIIIIGIALVLTPTGSYTFAAGIVILGSLFWFKAFTSTPTRQQHYQAEYLKEQEEKERLQQKHRTKLIEWLANQDMSQFSSYEEVENAYDKHINDLIDSRQFEDLKHDVEAYIAEKASLPTDDKMI